MFENRIKTQVAAGEAAWGLALPDASEFLAKTLINIGIDFLWIDLEHRPYDVERIRWLPLFCRQKGCVPLVRVAGLDSQLIKKALDIGASAIMVPQVNNAEEARRAVQYAKYPPAGTRGITPMWTSLMDVPLQDYLDHANDETCMVVQIESVEGMENLDEIAQVEGVDVMFAGPMDLSAAFGHIGQTKHPEVLEYLAEFPSRVAKYGKASGVTFQTFEECKWAHEKGYRFIAFGNAFQVVAQHLGADLQRGRGLDKA